MSDRIHGHTKSGTPITDELIEELADEAERGYDVDLRRRPEVMASQHEIPPRSLVVLDMTLDGLA